MSEQEYVDDDPREERDPIERAKTCAASNRPQTACAFALISIAVSLRRIAASQEAQ